jgi:dihydropteroate synthase
VCNELLAVPEEASAAACATRGRVLLEKAKLLRAHDVCLGTSVCGLKLLVCGLKLLRAHDVCLSVSLIRAFIQL